MARIAVASRSGTDVDEHFGRASFFRIYDLDGNGASPAGLRDVVAAVQHAAGRHVTNFDRVCGLLSDCDAVLVSRIGAEAAEYLLQRGIRVFEVRGSIDAVLAKLVKDRVFDADGGEPPS